MRNDNSNTNTSANISDLNDGKTHTGDYTIASVNTFGSDDSSKVTTINGNVNISLPNATQGQTITLKNMNINGTLTANFGEGDVELENVKVNGVTVTNIGSHSLHIKGNSAIGLLTIEDSNNDAHVVVEDNGSVANTSVLSGAKLEVASGAKNTKPFANVTIAPTSNEDVTLSGTFDSINITNPANVTVDASTKIKNQISVKSAASLNVAQGASVAKVDIAPSKADDKITLSGNLSNVNVSSAANVEVVSGKVDIGSNNNSNVKVSVDSDATVSTGKGNITTSGTGNVTKKTSLSDEAVIKGLTIDDASFNNGSTASTPQLYNIPAAITVQELLNNVSSSEFATVEVVDINGNVVDSNAYLTRVMKLRVISESGKVTNDYSINYFQNANGQTYDFKGLVYDPLLWQKPYEVDTNTQKGKFTGTISFKKPDDETDIDGYYVAIYGSSIVKYNPNTNKVNSSQLIYEIFLPKSNTVGDEYNAVFNNVDLKGYTELYSNVIPVVNNKMTTYINNRIYDNPVDTTIPSIAGITIGDFKDTDNKKGEITGTITFTKATDESHIKYYEVVIVKTYKTSDNYSSSEWDTVGCLEKSDAVNGVYTISTDNPVEVGNTDDIKIRVIPVSEDGIQNYNDQAAKTIVDQPESEQVKFIAPSVTADVSEDYRLNVSGCVEGAVLKIYKLDTTTNNYVPYVKNGQQVSVVAFGSAAEFDKVDIGTYKVTQTSAGKETDMSNSAVVKPMKLSGVLQNSSLSLINAIDGATIKVYDASGNVIKTVTKQAGQTAVIDGLTTGTYNVTQTVNGIESNKFVVPVGQDYTIDDILKSVIASLNKSNINAKLDGTSIVLSKKNAGSIGEISIDTGADLSVQLWGTISSDKIYKKLGTYNLNHAKAVSVNINSDYDTLKANYSQNNLQLTYNNKTYNYTVIMQ